LPIEKQNIGKIAERITMNEFEFNGYRATDLNKDGLSPNADILVVKNGKAWQVQVKGSANKPTEPWWINYGYCDQSMIQDRSAQAFNKRSDSYYRASHIAFVAARSPSQYRCLIVPVATAEMAVQLALDRSYRQPRKRDGGQYKPGKMWVSIEPSSRTNSERMEGERKLLLPFENHWELESETMK
jgi:hypothetical protein